MADTPPDAGSGKGSNIFKNVGASHNPRICPIASFRKNKQSESASLLQLQRMIADAANGTEMEEVRNILNEVQTKLEKVVQQQGLVDPGESTGADQTGSAPPDCGDKSEDGSLDASADPTQDKSQAGSGSLAWEKLEEEDIDHEAESEILKQMAKPTTPAQLEVQRTLIRVMSYRAVAPTMKGRVQGMINAFNACVNDTRGEPGDAQAPGPARRQPAGLTLSAPPTPAAPPPCRPRNSLDRDAIPKRPRPVMGEGSPSSSPHTPKATSPKKPAVMVAPGVVQAAARVVAASLAHAHHPPGGAAQPGRLTPGVYSPSPQASPSSSLSSSAHTSANSFTPLGHCTSSRPHVKELPYLEKVIIAQSCVRRFLAHRAVMRIRLETNLIRSEETYFQSLDLVAREYIEPLKRSGCLQEIDMDVLFSDISRIRSHQKLFLFELKTLHSNKKNFSQQFQQGPLFSDYATYIGNYRIITESFSRLVRENQQFSSIVSKAKENTKNPTLQDLISLPFGRLDLYLKFLTDMKAHSHYKHAEDYAVAISNLTDFKEAGHRLFLEGELAVTVVRIQSRLTGKGAPSLEGKRLRREGFVSWLRKGYTKKRSDVKLFVFEDMFMVCEEKVKEQGVQYHFKVKESLSDVLMIQNMDVDTDPGMFAWQVVCSKDKYMFAVTSEQSKDMWVKTFTVQAQPQKTNPLTRRFVYMAEEREKATKGSAAAVMCASSEHLLRSLPNSSASAPNIAKRNKRRSMFGTLKGSITPS
eukprot:CAMPEP_0177639120 /NCGR_PEP_ID=MMETSP0447-20121125/5853_1 /TAXON_ID=0 /ORGANISM="Stygamoeba regulata, Strain BSH-02190019" /LENGTH=752 /DNA_ID=CAMNT_0019141129 /DNA_START=144 /DNA_END=2402 /DNA_ORIENTATION=+